LPGDLVGVDTQTYDVQVSTPTRRKIRNALSGTADEEK
jgi:hypothetical protein